MHMIQLVSFGCGCDAITADECRRILEEHGQIYTQIKIDDIDNLGVCENPYPRPLCFGPLIYLI